LEPRRGDEKGSSNGNLADDAAPPSRLPTNKQKQQQQRQLQVPRPIFVPSLPKSGSSTDVSTVVEKNHLIFMLNIVPRGPKSEPVFGMSLSGEFHHFLLVVPPQHGPTLKTFPSNMKNGCARIARCRKPDWGVSIHWSKHWSRSAEHIPVPHGCWLCMTRSHGPNLQKHAATVLFGKLARLAAPHHPFVAW